MQDNPTASLPAEALAKAGRKKIGWIKFQSRKYGGVVYGEKVREVLSREFDVEVINIDSKYFKRGYLRAPEMVFNLLRVKGKKDLWIREDLYPAISLGLDRARGKSAALIFHIDFSLSPWPAKALDFILERAAWRGLKKADFIITISQYWQDRFLRLGRKAYKVYCPFDLSEFSISDDEVAKFKKDHGLEGKPIVYIGNCQKAKGVVESYASLKDLNLHLVTSGSPMVKIPAANLNLSRRDYLKLLKASSIVLAMSKFKEGWNMVAHEAMLLKTPVIGSGSGGMGELLQGGRQIICPDFKFLREKVEYLLNNPAVRGEMGNNGFEYAKNFTKERFENDWIDLVKKLTQ